MIEVMPNFFIVGAGKAGTTSLYSYLRRHPDVYMSPIKEPHWFSTVKPHPEQKAYAVTSEKEYLDLFKGWRGEKAIGEASTSYLWDDEEPARIRHNVPDAKIIVVLRELVSPASSHYLMGTRVGIQELPFYEAIKEDYEKLEKGWYISHLYVELGMNCEQISRFLDWFDRERLLMMFFEDVISDTDAALTSVASFVEIDTDAAYGGQTFEKQNPHATPRIGILRPALDNEGIRRLGQRLLPGDLSTRPIVTSRTRDDAIHWLQAR